MPAPLAAAAGALVWRGSGAAPLVAVVHRPRYDDWSLPKGKLTEDETELDAAVREISEEIGAQVTVGRRLGRAEYIIAGGDDPVRKNVAYWTMRYVDGEFAPSDEVDALEWLSPDAARERLTYVTDRAVLDEFLAVPAADSVIALVRHARAGKRSEWDGEDALRPLDESGQAQARGLVRFLTYFGADRVISADRVRCIQTVEPFAKAIGVAVEIDPTFNDESYLESPSRSLTTLLSLGKPGMATAVCSQGLTIPSLIDELGVGHLDSDTRKGAAWVLSVLDGEVLAADYYPTPGGPVPRPPVRGMG